MMFDEFRDRKDPNIKAMEKQEKKQMNFQREQNSLAAGSQEETAEVIHNEQKSDLIKWQQDLDEDLMEMVYQLKGWKKINGEWYKTDDCKPLCNDMFIQDVVIPQSKTFLSKNLLNSNFTEERILLDLRCTADDIADNMADGYDKYDIVFTNFDIILRLLKNVIKAGAFRSLNGFTKKTDSTIFKRIESSYENDQQERKKGMFSFAN